MTLIEIILAIPLILFILLTLSYQRGNCYSNSMRTTDIKLPPPTPLGKKCDCEK